MATKTSAGGIMGRVKRPFLQLGQFLREVWQELQRVVWPTHEETKGYTMVVIITIIIVALWVGFWDLIFGELINLLERL